MKDEVDLRRWHVKVPVTQKLGPESKTTTLQKVFRIEKRVFSRHVEKLDFLGPTRRNRSRTDTNLCCSSRFCIFIVFSCSTWPIGVEIAEIFKSFQRKSQNMPHWDIKTQHLYPEIS